MIHGINSYVSSMAWPVASLSQKDAAPASEPEEQERVAPAEGTEHTSDARDEATGSGVSGYNVTTLISMIRSSQSIIKSQLIRPAPPPMESVPIDLPPPIVQETQTLSDIVNNPDAVDSDQDGLISQQEVQGFVAEQIATMPKPALLS